MKISRALFIFFSLFLPVLIGSFLFATLNDLHPHKAYAASDAIVMVNTLNDKDDGSCTINDCSLREAITAANTDDTIVFDVAGTIVLSPTLGDLDIAKSLTISGASIITVSGNNAVRVFNITAGHVTFDGLKIISGTVTTDDCSEQTWKCGGGIMIQNSDVVVTIHNSTISGNSSNNGSGIYNLGKLSINNSNLSENSTFYGGGSIYNRGILTVSKSVLSKNWAFCCGGGIYNLGIVTIKDSTINGNGNGTNGSGGGIYNENGGFVTISRSMISENSGGGIFNYSTGVVNLNDSTISNNDGRGITNLGTLSVNNSFISKNATGSGSGIYNSDNGIATVNNSTLSDNSASNSGAILNRGTMTVSNSTLSDNKVKNCGGGIRNTPYDANLLVINSTISGNEANCGGGIINNGTVTLSNSTISENKARTGGGIYNSVDATMLINNSTLFNNSSSSSSGTIHNLSTVTMMNSILANSPDSDNCDSHIDIISNGNNIDSDDSCNLNKFSDIINVDPLLAPLTNNGGDTKTHLLLAGSPAINEGNCSNSSPAIDQRGVARPQNTSCDIGAVEMVPCSHSITILNSNSKNAGSLRQALSDICDGGLITFDNAVTNNTIDTSPEGELLIYKSVTISGTVPITISGNNTTRVFNVMTNTVSPNVNVTFDSLNIVNGNVQTDDCGDLDLFKCGGGIMVQNSGVAVTVTKSTLAGNTAENGGGIYNFGTVTVNNSTLSSNIAITNGGGIDNVGILSVSNSTIAYNSADVLGGGIHNITDTVTVNHSVIANSTSGSDCDGTAIISAGYNLDSDDSCNLYAGGDIVNANPKLGPLTDNGAIH